MKNEDTRNPVQSFLQVWKVFEKLAVLFSAALVIGTVGYVSIYALA